MVNGLPPHPLEDWTLISITGFGKDDARRGQRQHCQIFSERKFPGNRKEGERRRCRRWLLTTRKRLEQPAWDDRGGDELMQTA